MRCQLTPWLAESSTLKYAADGPVAACAVPPRAPAKASAARRGMAFMPRSCAFAGGTAMVVAVPQHECTGADRRAVPRAGPKLSPLDDEGCRSDGNANSRDW